ncbi:MAG: flavodoxin-dependent (E)-4-hydroxy-3-methylbut-2-enyl-diphosphate synthase, partial [Planctomycetia bacterium]|nr:flavodoxin-dependent (E)-4-hydroxy-3-methylbut-2-enyl-diphosphate synthase [Planctomycetia bacterium]
ALLASAIEHGEFLESVGFTRYCVSLKDSDPRTVVELNRRFAAAMPHVPLHLGVTEAGMPPEGILTTRVAFEPLLRDGIGETMRVSLTVPNAEKSLEVEAAQSILADVAAGRILTDPDRASLTVGPDIVSCPSCARVENERFVELARQIRDLVRPFTGLPVRIAVMGCRVNGPGETDDADLGLWCGMDRVNLKRGVTSLGTFTYEEIGERFMEELRSIADARGF